MLSRWFGVSRFVYNQTVESLRQPGTKASWMSLKTGSIHDLPDWASDVPYQIKSIAIRDACQAVSNAKKKFKETGEFHSVKFRSKKQPYQTLFIPKSAISELGVYQTRLGTLKMAETLPESPKDSRLIKENDDYFLCVPHESPIILRNQQREPSCRVVSCDPGIRTFLTLFSEDGFGWLGLQSINKIQRLCTYLDDLLSRADSSRRPKRRNLRRAANRLRRRIRNLVDELHHKVAKFLVENFDLILLPTFETSDMTKRGGRKLRKKSVRQMLTLSHYRFKKFLHHKAKEYGKVVIDVCEAYTSQTVSWTGEVIANLGGRKVIKASDGTIMDRDLNGARGIFLRALGDSPMLQKLCAWHANHVIPACLELSRF
jgi:putative transposase